MVFVWDIKVYFIQGVQGQWGAMQVFIGDIKEWIQIGGRVLASCLHLPGGVVGCWLM